MTVECYPAVAAWLIGTDGQQLGWLRQHLGKEILVRGDSSLRMDEVKLEARQSDQCGRMLPSA